jgi:hypothetical protein
MNFGGMNFAARLGCTAVGLRSPSVASQTHIKPTTEPRQESTYQKAKAVQTNGATSMGGKKQGAQSPLSLAMTLAIDAARRTLTGK